MSRSANRNQAPPSRTYNDDIHQTDDYGEEEVTTGRRKAYSGNGSINGSGNGHINRGSTSEVPQLSRAGPPNGRGGSGSQRGGASRRGGRPHAPDTYSTPATSSASSSGNGNGNGKSNTRVISETIEKRVPAPHDLTGLILSGLMAAGVGKTASFSADEKAFIVTGTRQEVARTEKLINELRNQYVEKRGHELQAKIDNTNGSRANGRESKNSKGKAAAAATTVAAPAKKEKKGKKDKTATAGGDREEKKRPASAPVAAASSPAKKGKKAATETKATATAVPASSANVEGEPIGAGVTIVTDECKRKLEISADIIKYISARVRQIISKSRAKVTEERPFITLEGTRVQVEKAEKQIRKFADEGARKKVDKDGARESKSPATAAVTGAPKKEKADKKEKKGTTAAATTAAAPSKKVAESKTSANGTKAVVTEAAAKKERKKKERKEKTAAGTTNGESKTPAAAPAPKAAKPTPSPSPVANVSEQPKEPKTSEVYVPDEVFQAVVGDAYSELQAISDQLHVTMNVTQSETENRRVIVLRGQPSHVNKAKGRLLGRIKYVRSVGRREAKRTVAAAATPVTADATAPAAATGAAATTSADAA